MSVSLLLQMMLFNPKDLQGFINELTFSDKVKS